MSAGAFSIEEFSMRTVAIDRMDRRIRYPPRTYRNQNRLEPRINVFGMVYAV